jgi:hypothetical protein
MPTLWLAVLAIVTASSPTVPVLPPGAPAPTANEALPLPGTPPVSSRSAPGPLPSAITLLREAVALEPAGALVRLGEEPETVIDPAATFRVELAGSLRDARVLLLDGADAAVPASATREVGATTRLTLAPAAPLRPGSRYVLRIDGTTTKELHDGAGVAYGPVSVGLLAAGEPPRPEPKQRTKPSRKKRGARR